MVERGLKKDLTSYGDAEFSLFLRRAFIKAAGYSAVVFTIDARTAMRHESNSVDDLVAGAIRNNDVLIPFGSVDPWHERRAVHRVHELVRDYGVKGFKFHPSMQAFEPNDRRFYPIYEAITEAGVPALFHTGQTGIGAGLPGGHRIKLRYSDPMLLDDVAADFPELTIVMAHPAVPWVDSQIAIASHKSNVYVDPAESDQTPGSTCSACPGVCAAPVVQRVVASSSSAADPPAGTSSSVR